MEKPHRQNHDHLACPNSFPRDSHTDEPKLVDAVRRASVESQVGLSARTFQDLIEDLFEEQETLDQNEMRLLRRVLIHILDAEKAGKVTQKAFVEAVVNADIGTMKNCADLYDMDRTPSFLERLFDTGTKRRRKLASESSRDSGNASTNALDSTTSGADTNALDSSASGVDANASSAAAGIASASEPDASAARNIPSGVVDLGSPADESVDAADDPRFECEVRSV